jgi:succinyl-CoA synthetase beta subunit
MNILEHEARRILIDYEVPMPDSGLAINAKETVDLCNKFSYPIVIKALVATGGRGKAGGVKLVNNDKEAADYAKNILGTQLITVQTGPKGLLVDKLLITPAYTIDKEYYLSITIDRDSACIIFLLSASGGVDIEKVAKESPEKIHKFKIYYSYGLLDFQLREMAFALSPDKSLHHNFILCFKRLYNCFVGENASMLEINPLVSSPSGDVAVLDVKLSLNSEEEAGMSYVALSGNIGCMVNGAGLAMATMDLIKFKGGEPANFLDVGGGACEETISKGFDMIQDDENVKVILVNIFGGIVHCDVVAQGIIDSCRKNMPRANLVVRLQGTNADQGLKLLRDSSLDIKVATQFEEAVEEAVSLLNTK